MLGIDNEVYAIAEMFVKDYGRYPSIAELTELGITRAKVRERYGNMETLCSVLAKNLSDYIFDVANGSFKQFDYNKSGRYILTTAVAGDVVNFDFFQSLKIYAKKNKAQLVVLVALKQRTSQYLIDPVLRDEYFIIDETPINSNLYVSGAMSISTRLDPLSSIPKQIGHSVIVAAPRQALKYVATGVDKAPHARVSTGAITTPRYKGKYRQFDSRSKMAEVDHKIGALIVELEGDKFHFRNIQASSDGSFCDLGIRYSKNGIAKESPAAMVLGDWHVGSTCPVVRKTTFDMIKKMKPKEVYLHDLEDFYSTNPHVVGRQLTLSKMADSGMLSLNDELTAIKNEVEVFSNLCEKVFVVNSNHSKFITRYLESGAFVKHPYNATIASELWGQAVKGHNIVEYFVNSRSKRDLTNVTWLKEDDTRRIAGVELASHGSNGPSGTKGSPGALESSYSKAVFGHFHSPQLFRNIAIVGTSTHLKLDYTKGPSNWMNTHCLLYSDGTMQLINIIEGKYRGAGK